MDIVIVRMQKQGRTHILLSMTPKSPETSALLREFKAGVTQLEKKWKAIAAATKRARAQKKGKR